MPHIHTITTPRLELAAIALQAARWSLEPSYRQPTPWEQDKIDRLNAKRAYIDSIIRKRELGLLPRVLLWNGRKLNRVD